MKKRICSLVLLSLTLLLAAPVRAERVSIADLRAQADALGGRYAAHYEIDGGALDIDARLSVPQVDAFPVLLVEPLIPLSSAQAEDVRANATYAGNETYVYTMQDGERAGDVCKIALRTPFDWAKNAYPHELEARTGLSLVCNDDLLHPQTKFRNPVYQTEDYFPEELSPDAAYAEDNPMTYGEARDMVLGLYRALYPGEALTLQIREVRGNRRGREGDWQTGEVTGGTVEGAAIGSYSFSFTQTLMSIPLLDIIPQVLNTPYSALDPSPHRDLIEALMRCKTDFSGATILSDRAFSIKPAANRVLDVLHEDVPLAPLAEVMRGVEALIRSGHIRDVYAIELGYVAYLAPGTTDAFVLAPTWTVSCAYRENPDQALDAFSRQVLDGYGGNIHLLNSSANPEHRVLAVNAQTGALCPVGEATADDLYCPPVLTWDGAQ